MLLIRKYNISIKNKLDDKIFFVDKYKFVKYNSIKFYFSNSIQYTKKDIIKD